MKVAALLLALAAGSATAADCGKTDLRCRGAAGLAAAAAACPAHIEQQSEYSVRWTDAPGTAKFSRFNWTAEPGGTLTFIGDRIEFQSPTGAYKPMRYLCEMAADGKTVVGARVYEGRLPIQ
jgi:hypothetical protein